MHKTIVLILLATAISGCADSGDGAEAPEETFNDKLDEELKPTETTGIIRGVVLTETIQPIANASIKILGLGLTTTSGADGTFGFADLEPAAYFLEISKGGYNSTQASVTVEAAVEKPPVVKVVLPYNPGTAPYWVPHPWDGVIGCSVMFVVPIGYAGYSACSAGALGVCPGCMLTSDDFAQRLDFDKRPDFLQVEVYWDSTSDFGDALSLSVGVPSCADNVWKAAAGVSPLVARMNSDDIEARNMDATCLRLFSWGNPDFGGVFGAQVEQGFSTLTHAFYNMEPREDWQFYLHGDYPLDGN